MTLVTTLVEKGFEPITPKTTLPAIFRKVYAPTFTVIVIVEVNGGRHELWIRNGASEMGVGDLSYNEMSERNVLDLLNVVEQAYRAGDLYGSTAKMVAAPKPATKVKPIGKWGGHEDWIPWSGGECPVSKGAAVNLVYRDGGLGFYVDATVIRWAHIGRGGDILAYRVVSAEPEPAVESKPIPTSESVWRSCTDDLPESGRAMCLAWKGLALVDSGYYVANQGKWYSSNQRNPFSPQPDYWQPLPEPPKGV